MSRTCCGEEKHMLGANDFALRFSLAGPAILPNTVKRASVPPPVPSEAPRRIVMQFGKPDSKNEARSKHELAMKLLALKKLAFENGFLPVGTVVSLKDDVLTITQGSLKLVVPQFEAVKARADEDMTTENARREREWMIEEANRISESEQLRLQYFAGTLPKDAQVEVRKGYVRITVGKVKSSFFPDQQLIAMIENEQRQAQTERLRQRNVQAMNTIAAPKPDAVHVPCRIEDLTCQARRVEPKPKSEKTGKKGKKK
jgi:hypothetical protein